MNMNAYKSLFLGSSLISATLTVQAQGTFQNLGFESANLSPLPAGQYGGGVSSLDGMPGWTGFLGANQVTQVLQNNYTLGNASIDILGPNWNGGSIIEGSYTIVLQPGLDPFGSGQLVSASISQTGLVPATAQSLQFKAAIFSAFSVSIGGDDLSLIILGTGPNYTLYGADISGFAGQTEVLTVRAIAALPTTDYFDSFGFSSSSVPEPSVLALSILGASLLGWGVMRGRR